MLPQNYILYIKQSFFKNIYICFIYLFYCAHLKKKHFKSTILKYDFHTLHLKIGLDYKIRKIFHVFH